MPCQSLAALLGPKLCLQLGSSPPWAQHSACLSDRPRQNCPVALSPPMAPLKLKCFPSALCLAGQLLSGLAAALWMIFSLFCLSAPLSTLPVIRSAQPTLGQIKPAEPLLFLPPFGGTELWSWGNHFIPWLWTGRENEVINWISAGTLSVARRERGSAQDILVYYWH